MLLLPNQSHRATLTLFQIYILVYYVKLLGGRILLQQLAGDLLLCSKNDPIFRENS